MQNQNLTRRQPTANRIRQVDEKVKSVKVALEQINVKAAAHKAGVASSTLRYDLGKLEMALPQILTNQAPGPKPVAPASVAPTPAKENRECSECGGKVSKNGTYWILNWLLMLTMGWLGIQKVLVQRYRCKECGHEEVSEQRAQQAKACEAWWQA